jgi:predicted MPP superfamily phosphohydrolase
MRKNKRNIFRTIILLAIILLPLSIALYAYYIEPFWIKTINYQISSAGINEKIVFISDTHFGENYSRENLEKVVSEINAQNPDLVILGGDYIDKNPKYTAEYFEIIKKLEAKDGIFAVLGNHDMNSHLLSKVKAGLQLDNINLLENKIYILE